MSTTTFSIQEANSAGRKVGVRWEEFLQELENNTFTKLEVVIGRQRIHTCVFSLVIEGEDAVLMYEQKGKKVHLVCPKNLWGIYTTGIISPQEAQIQLINSHYGTTLLLH